MDSWWHFSLGSFVGWLIYLLTYLLSGIMMGAMGFPATMTLCGLHIDISTIQFSVCSFLALFGSCLLHLPMDYLWSYEITDPTDRSIIIYISTMIILLWGVYLIYVLKNGVS